MIRILGLAATALLVLAANASANHNLRDLVSTGPAGGNGTFDQTFRGSSVDGTRVFFTTNEQLVLSDTDTSVDLYERVGTSTNKISPGNGAFNVTYAGASDDGTRVYFETNEQLTATDTDIADDIYRNFNGAISHVTSGNGGYSVSFLDTSADGARAFYVTNERVVAEDEDSSDDIYEWTSGGTVLVSTGPNCGFCGGDAFFDAASADGTRVIFTTSNHLVANDTDSSSDIYMREGGATTLLTPSNVIASPTIINEFAGASKDATKVFFSTNERLDPSADTDARLDIYRTVGGSMTLISTGPAGGNGTFTVPTFLGVSDDGSHVFFSTSEPLVSGDTDATDEDIYERSAGTTTLPAGGSNSAYRGISADGSRLFVETGEQLVPADTDNGLDVYRFEGGIATLLSIGSGGGTSAQNATFAGISADGARAFFKSPDRLEPNDGDSSFDIYERYNGATTLISTGPADQNDPFQGYVYGGASANGDHVFFDVINNSLVAADTDNSRDVYQAVFDPDLDDDGLLNEWETNGLTVGSDFIDLPAMGASPIHKDVFVEIDYMANGSGLHSHKPFQSAINTVITAFDNAPVSNPDSTNGVHLHVDYGPSSPLRWVPGTWGALSRSTNVPERTNLGTGAGTTASPYDWTEFDAYKSANFTPARAQVFHYNVWAHKLSEALGKTSGYSREFPSSDFIVSLGGWGSDVGTTDEQAGTFMHELGHNLGLGHGGGDDTQWKPNLMSVMNYSFQTRGLIVDGKEGTFDYSRSALPALNENSLDESAGIGTGSTRGTRYFCGLDNEVIDLDGSSMDWNCMNGDTETGIAANINQGITDTEDTTLTILAGHDDWSNLVYDGGAVGGLGGGTLPQTTVANELTEEQNAALPDLTSRYARPKGATPLRVPLVPAFVPCSASNRTHGPPLAFASCNPPQLESGQLTMGTQDANGHPANSVGSVRYGVTGTPGGIDDTDVSFSVSLTDVRGQGTLADYTGELQTVAVARITDRINGPAGIEPSTVSDLSFPVTVPCTATGGTADIGATCAVTTSLDAVMAGAIPEGKRAVWGMQQVKVFDGGPDNDVDTAPNTLFAVQGVFVP